MKLGFLSDVHGNLLAFQKSLSFLESSADKIYFLGDIFGYMPDGSAILEIIRQKKIEMILGNHDAMVTGKLEIDAAKDKVYCLKEQIKSIPESEISYLTSQPLSREIVLDGTKILMVHGSPWNKLTEYIYEDDADERFDNLNVNLVILGHTHIPFIKKRENITVINSGSAGLPRDIGNSSCVTVFDSVTKEIKQTRLAFDENFVIEKYKDQLHESVISCLKRK